MKILLSPSESKQYIMPSRTQHNAKQKLLDDGMWGGQDARNAYVQEYLKALRSVNERELCKMFGTKKLNMDTLAHCNNVLEGERIEAIRLYTGVAYKALGFEGLERYAQMFVLDSVLIMSNVFGLVRAFDMLPYYHLNQNYRSNTLSLRLLYRAQEAEIDKLLAQENTIIDLRAQVYRAAYPLKCPHYVLELPQHTSHSAKHYRGLALKALAEHYAKLVSINKNATYHNNETSMRAMLNYVKEHFVYCENNA